MKDREYVIHVVSGTHWDREWRYTVVDIDPKGKICPLYRRDAYKADTAPMKSVTRFVPESEILW